MEKISIQLNERFFFILGKSWGKVGDLGKINLI